MWVSRISDTCETFTYGHSVGNWVCKSATPVQWLSRARLFVTPRTAAHQASLSITNSWSLLKLMSIVSDAIQPSHPLSSPSPPAFNLSQHQGLFQWVSSHQVAKITGGNSRGQQKSTLRSTDSLLTSFSFANFLLSFPSLTSCFLHVRSFPACSDPLSSIYTHFYPG